MEKLGVAIREIGGQNSIRSHAARPSRRRSSLTLAWGPFDIRRVPAATAMAKPLVIVESPAKARTISRYLGSDFTVEASIGHVRDLPGSASEIPAAYKKQKWSRIGVDVEHGFEPLYIVPPEKKDHVAKLKALLQKASELYLATDEDREGEAISWHLLEVLKPKKGMPVKRLVFHEITKDAILEALEHPRDVDTHLVAAQETRRIVDRLYGYEVSPLLWKKIRPRLSAGRVQSVAVRLVVERERERLQFRAAQYWDLSAIFAKMTGAAVEAGLASIGGVRVATGKDFSDQGRLKDADVVALGAADATSLRESLSKSDFFVESVEERDHVERPYAPFTTSTLQQEANRRLKFTARRTMQAAQRLYENGLITYMRTDSTTLSEQAIRAARRLIEENYGGEYLPSHARRYETKVKNAQEAHEAIRPAGAEFRHPDSLRDLGIDEQKVYELVWKRTVASQMADARVKRTSAVIASRAAVSAGSASGPARFTASGKTIEFPGYLRAYVEGSDNPEEALADRETILPPLAVGEALKVQKMEAVSHETQPPARLTEASLVKELEARGIGRPSTYASIIDTILDRGYVFKKGNALVPTFTAFAVIQLLEQHLSHLVDYGFTAHMEDDLDEISLGNKKSDSYLQTFYYGNGVPGLKPMLGTVDEKIDPRIVCGIPLGKAPNGTLVEIRVGRYGPFLSMGEVRASVPEETAPDEMSLERALELLQKAKEGPKSLGTDPATALPVYVKSGRFGPYFQLGDAAPDGEKPKMASLLAGMKPDTVTLEEALACLSLPKTLGTNPQNDEPVVAASGRFGPYVKCGSETRSIPETSSPIRITLEEALALLAAPKLTGKARFARKIEPLKVLGASPVTKSDVKLMSGRYGPYVTDGTTNASLPKGTAPESLSLEAALDLLAARAAAGPSKKRRPMKRRAPAKRSS